MMKLSYGIVGSIGFETEERDHPYTLLRDERVQALLLDLAPEPLPLAELGRRHPGLDDKVGELVRLTLLRVEDGRAHVNFTLLTGRDKELAFAAGEWAAESLGGTILARRADLERVMAGYPYPHVTRDKLAYMLIGCYFLDFACLALLRDAGYRAPTKEMPGGNRYILRAEEEVDGRSFKEVYWGGHSEEVTRYVFNTFGDHAPETRRIAFPDLAWSLGWDPDVHSFRLAVRERVLPLMDDLAAILEAVGPDGAERRVLAGGGLLIDLLTDLDYLRDIGGRLHLVVPFFTTAETEMVRSLFALLRPAVLDWFSANYDDLKRRVESLTPLRHGVPFGEVMTHLWHYLFGLTNRRLAREGFFVDTYKEVPRRHGYLPGVYPREWEALLGSGGTV